VKIGGGGTVTRLYESPVGWYRGTVNAPGIIDDVFYNEKTNRIVCGHKGWERFADSASVRFTEVGEVAKPKL
jgi:hypothetical protein